MYGAMFVDIKADLVKVSPNSERMNGGVEVEVACDQRGSEGE